MKFLLITSILLSSVGCLFAVQCYSCAYIAAMGGSECMDPFTPNENETMCEGTYCSKSISKLSGELASVTRSCGMACSELCASFLGIEGCNYCCQGNLCNTAESVTFSLLTTVTMVTAGLKLTA